MAFFAPNIQFSNFQSRTKREQDHQKRAKKTHTQAKTKKLTTAYLRRRQHFSTHQLIFMTAIYIQSGVYENLDEPHLQFKIVSQLNIFGMHYVNRLQPSSALRSAPALITNIFIIESKSIMTTYIRFAWTERDSVKCPRTESLYRHRFSALEKSQTLPFKRFICKQIAFHSLRSLAHTNAFHKRRFINLNSFNSMHENQAFGVERFFAVHFIARFSNSNRQHDSGKKLVWPKPKYSCILVYI